MNDEKIEEETIAHCMKCEKFTKIKTYENDDTGRYVYLCDTCYEKFPCCRGAEEATK